MHAEAFFKTEGNAGNTALKKLLINGMAMNNATLFRSCTASQNNAFIVGGSLAMRSFGLGALSAFIGEQTILVSQIQACYFG